MHVCPWISFTTLEIHSLSYCFPGWGSKDPLIFLARVFRPLPSSCIAVVRLALTAISDGVCAENPTHAHSFHTRSLGAHCLPSTGGAVNKTPPPASLWGLTVSWRKRGEKNTD